MNGSLARCMKLSRRIPRHKTIDWYVGLEFVSKSSIMAERTKYTGGVSMRTRFDDSLPMAFKPVGTYTDVLIDSVPISSYDAKGDTIIHGTIACRLKKGDILDCWSMKSDAWDGLFPTMDDIHGIEIAVNEREINLINDDRGIVFADLATPHAPELEKVLVNTYHEGYKSSYGAKAYVMDQVKVKPRAFVYRDINWLDLLISKGGAPKSMKRKDVINIYNHFINTRLGKEKTTGEMIAFIKLSKIVKKLIDPHEVRDMIDDDLDGSIMYMLRKGVDAHYLVGGKGRDDRRPVLTSIWRRWLDWH